MAALLVLVPLLLTASTIVLAVPALKRCPDCRGADLGRATFVRKPGYCGTPVAAIRCPRCGDRGRVSVLRAWLGLPLGPGVGALVRAENDPYFREFNELLDQAVRQDGQDPSAVCGWSSPPAAKGRGWARFVKAEGKDFVLALFYPDPRPGPVRAGLVLMDLRGRVADTLHFATDATGAYLTGKFLEEMAGDGAVVRMIFRAELRQSPARFTVERRGKPVAIPAPESFETGRGVAGCRVGILGDRLAVLSPGGIR